MQKGLIMVGILIVGYVLFLSPDSPIIHETPSSIADLPTDESAATIAEAFSKQQSDVQVSGLGVVIKVLADDNSGSRHQKFILKLASEQTLLVAHNIDLAPRIPALQKGDRVGFYGEYEWNERGGVVHWTHRDPKGSHVDGWLEHKGRRYE